ncbi:MAG: hypothetical protein RR857_09625 [Comamonas sp.]|uniref:hypothetical protein n=2 Tax=Comamonas sp. TaxID=34028 RepID=UPI002FC9E5DA
MADIQHMTYIADMTCIVDLPLESHEHGFACFSCGQPLASSGVRYDGKGGSILLHLRCANEMGQRLIVDSWTNRRKHVHAAG